LKRFFCAILAEWKLVILPALLKWGIWGVGAVAVLDSSSIPVPMDAILALYVWNDKPHFWLYCLMAAAGSAIGGLLPYGLGRAGGELFLLKRVDRAKFERLRDRFERQEFLAVMIPSMMPPPRRGRCSSSLPAYLRCACPIFCWLCLREEWCAGWRSPCWCSSSVPARRSGGAHALVAVLIVGALAVLGFAWWWIRKKRQGKLLEG
jgi:membrane protein DedA with SNARE-associated domain